MALAAAGSLLCAAGCRPTERVAKRGAGTTEFKPDPDKPRPTEEGEGVQGYLRDVEIVARRRVDDGGAVPAVVCRTIEATPKVCTLQPVAGAPAGDVVAATCKDFAGADISCSTERTGEGPRIVLFDRGGSEPESVLKLRAGKLAFDVVVAADTFPRATIDAAATTALAPAVEAPPASGLAGAWGAACVSGAADCNGGLPAAVRFDDLQAGGRTRVAVWREPERADRCIVGAEGARKFEPALTLASGTRVPFALGNVADYEKSLDALAVALPAAARASLRAYAVANAGTIDCEAAANAAKRECARSTTYPGLRSYQVDVLREGLHSLVYGDVLAAAPGETPRAAASCVVEEPDALDACLEETIAPEHERFCEALDEASLQLLVELDDAGDLVASDPAAAVSLADCALPPAGLRQFCWEVDTAAFALGLRLDGGRLVVNTEPGAPPAMRSVAADDPWVDLCPVARDAAGPVTGVACGAELAAADAATQLARMRALLGEPVTVATLCPGAPDGAACRAAFLALDPAMRDARIAALAQDPISVRAAACAAPELVTALASAVPAACLPRELGFFPCFGGGPTCAAALLCSGPVGLQACADPSGRLLADFPGLEAIFDLRRADGVVSLVAEQRSEPFPYRGGECRMSAVRVMQGLASSPSSQAALDYQNGVSFQCSVEPQRIDLSATRRYELDGPR